MYKTKRGAIFMPALLTIVISPLLTLLCELTHVNKTKLPIICGLLRNFKMLSSENINH